MLGSDYSADSVNGVLLSSQFVPSNAGTGQTRRPLTRRIFPPLECPWRGATGSQAGRRTGDRSSTLRPMRRRPQEMLQWSRFPSQARQWSAEATAWQPLSPVQRSSRPRERSENRRRIVNRKRDPMPRAAYPPSQLEVYRSQAYCPNALQWIVDVLATLVECRFVADPCLMQTAWITRMSHGRDRQHATRSSPSDFSGAAVRMLEVQIFLGHRAIFHRLLLRRRGAILAIHSGR